MVCSFCGGVNAGVTVFNSSFDRGATICTECLFHLSKVYDDIQLFSELHRERASIIRGKVQHNLKVIEGGKCGGD